MKAAMEQPQNPAPQYFAVAVMLKIFAWVSMISLHEAFSYFASAGAGVAGFMGAWHYWVVIRDKRKSKSKI